MENNKKPDWITPQEWAVNPNIYHWEQSRKAMQFVKQSKPVSRVQVLAMMEKRYESIGLSKKDYENSLNYPYKTKTDNLI